MYGNFDKLSSSFKYSTVNSGEKFQMTAKTKPLHYRIYLLTIWVEPGREDEATQMWRFSLKNPRTGQRRGFTNLTELVIALHTELIENHQEALNHLE
jgi:hypothetical protein